MKLKQVCMLSVVLYAAYVVMEFLIHGKLLAGMYMETASVWRPEADMKKFFLFMMLGNLFFAKFFAYVFARGYEAGKGGIGQGLRCGLVFGLLLAPVGSLIWYAILPIPAILAFYWFATAFAEMIVLGLIAGAVYRP